MDNKEQIQLLINSLLSINGVIVKHYQKDDIIADYMEKRDRIFILMEGEADLIKYDRKGGKYILEHYYEHDLFGEIFHNITTSGEYSVSATSECSTMVFSLSMIMEVISRKKNNHELINALLQVFRIKFEQLNFHIEMLSQRTIRDRLLIYFNDLANRNYQRVFYIPMNYTQLADFLSVDRSAMMREIKNLEIEGFIDRHKYRIRLLTNI